MNRKDEQAQGSELSGGLDAVFYPKAAVYLSNLENVCRTHNLPKPMGVILADNEFDEFRKWAVRFLGADKCMLESGNLVLWSGMELRRQHPLFPPDE